MLAYDNFLVKYPKAVDFEALGQADFKKKSTRFCRCKRENENRQNKLR
jgi:hypothetical protein